LDKTSSSKASLSVQAIVLAEIFWAVAALLFFLLGGISLQSGAEAPFWYAFGTAFFEVGAFFIAAILCLRNWGSSQIVSGRSVWLFIGLGLLCYGIGSLLFTYWETGLGREPDVSPGDLFFVLTYILLIIGMVQAVATRRLNLEISQWGIVTGIAFIGILIAYLVFSAAQTPQSSLFMAPAMAQTAPAKPDTATPTKPAAKPAAKASPTAKPAVKPSPAATPPAAPDKPPAANSDPPKAAPKTAPPTTSDQLATPAADKKPVAPAWAIAIEEQMAPLKLYLDWYYIISDVILLTVATTLLLAFWGGRFAQSWRLIAAAAFSLYIADMWFKYASPRPGYQSGGLLEVFWIFSAVLFGIGAALEYDLSSRSRSRSSSRRRAS
jgi:hypothetical protein